MLGSYLNVTTGAVDLNYVIPQLSRHSKREHVSRFGKRTDNAPKVHPFATLCQEPEVELALV